MRRVVYAFRPCGPPPVGPASEAFVFGGLARDYVLYDPPMGSAELLQRGVHQFLLSETSVSAAVVREGV